MSKAFVLVGGEYFRYDVGTDSTDPGYPKAISAGWSGIADVGFGDGVDAALDLGTGKVYFFKADLYIRVDQSSNTVDGQPTAIAGNWPGLNEAGFAADLDAAANWGDGTAYFFKGDQTLRYHLAEDRAMPGYPRPIREEFPALADTGFDSGLQAAVMWPSGNAWFFRGPDCFMMAPGGDTWTGPILGNWPGLPGPIDAIWIKLDTTVQPGATTPARQLTTAQALAELTALMTSGLITFAQSAMPEKVDLDGLIPFTGQAQNGNVAGVQIRYLASGSRLTGSPSNPNAPDRLDPRNALAIVRFCEWLHTTFGVTEMYHLGIDGDGTGTRTDCHGQGRAIDFVGVKGNREGQDYALTVKDDWGMVETPSTPGGVWQPIGTTSTHFRLDDAADHPLAQNFFQNTYTFIAGQWQDRSPNPDGPAPATLIGQRSFIMHPDHPTSAPGAKNGREAHIDHIHMQIGVTGTA